MKNKRIVLRLVAAMGVSLISVSCQTSRVELAPIEVVASGHEITTASDPGEVAGGGEKVFATKEAMVVGQWVVRAGAEVTVREDGLGELNCLVDSSRGASGNYGATLKVSAFDESGQFLFFVPGSERGVPLAARSAGRVLPCKLQFGFDRSLYPLIDGVQFSGRTLLPTTSGGGEVGGGVSAGAPTGGRSSILGWWKGRSGGAGGPEGESAAVSSL